MNQDNSATGIHDAVRTILKWVGEGPDREGLCDTPARVARAWQHWCGGYSIDPIAELNRTFREVAGYDEMAVLRSIRFVSHCEHHLAPIICTAHVGYIPDGRMVGISKLARVVDAYARRLQVQEKMATEIAHCILDVLKPRGVAVMVEGEHLCVGSRGAERPDTRMVTSQMPGLFRRDPRTREEFLKFTQTRS